jgi:hypothetical protein
VTLGGAVANDDALRVVRGAVAAASEGDDHALATALDRILAAGLALRDGMYLGGAHLLARRPPGTTHIRSCACCGEVFRAGTARTVFCGTACRKAAHEGRSRRRERAPLERGSSGGVGSVEGSCATRLQEGLALLRGTRIDAATRIDGRSVIEEAQSQARLRSPRVSSRSEQR